MNVYKIIDTSATYSGGMGLVAANNEQEAVKVFDRDTELKNYNYDYDENAFEAYILEMLVSNATEPYLITEEFYYE